MPTAAHFIYIPAILILGIVIGFVLGGRAARDAFAAQKEKEDVRAARRAARAANGAPPASPSKEGTTRGSPSSSNDH